MIQELQEQHIPDIAEAHVEAWRVAFKDILSAELLQSLEVEDFRANWETIIQFKERKNYIYQVDQGKAVGFVSFGIPKDDQETADWEIYGIYVHPQYWGKGIGYALMKYALDQLKELRKGSEVVLWTMADNVRSTSFYTKYGFSKSKHSRTSSRNGESFIEIQYRMKL